MTDRGIGLAAAVDPDTLLASAQTSERLGFHSFWLNNPPGGDAISRLGAIASDVPTLMLGVGVIPLSHVSAEEIAASVEREGVPLNRLYLGVGSGTGAGGLERVRDGVVTLRALTAGRMVVAALGPRMCRLSGEIADGVLLNWLTPGAARQSCDWIRQGALAAGRSMPRVMAYVRVALEGEGAERLAREAATYESYPQYAAHLARMGVRAVDTAIIGSPGEVADAVAQWDSVVDEVILRVVTAHDSTEEIRRVAYATAPDAAKT